MRIPEYVLTQTCQIKPYIGKTPSGPTYGTTLENIKCRFEFHKKKYVNEEGREFVSNGRIFLLPTDENWDLKLDSHFTVEGGEYIAMDIKRHVGFTRSHVEVVVV